MSTQPIELSAMEVLFLTDRVQNADREDGHEIAKPLLLKLGSAYLEMIGDTAKAGCVTLKLTEPEVWLARSKFNSGDRCDADSKLGVHILRKLYAALLAFNAEMDQWPDAEQPDRTLPEVAQAQAWLPPEFGLGRAKTLEETTDDYGWEQREV